MLCPPTVWLRCRCVRGRQLYPRAGGSIFEGAEVVTELRLQVAAAAAESYMYLDVIMVCGEPAYAERQRDMIANPSGMVKVLSESTEGWDRGGKFAGVGAIVARCDPDAVVYAGG